MTHVPIWKLLLWLLLRKHWYWLLRSVVTHGTASSGYLIPSAELLGWVETSETLLYLFASLELQLLAWASVGQGAALGYLGLLELGLLDFGRIVKIYVFINLHHGITVASSKPLVELNVHHVMLVLNNLWRLMDKFILLCFLDSLSDCLNATIPLDLTLLVVDLLLELEDLSVFLGEVFSHRIQLFFTFNLVNGLELNVLVHQRSVLTLKLIVQAQQLILHTLVHEVFRLELLFQVRNLFL